MPAPVCGLAAHWRLHALILVIIAIWFGVAYVVNFIYIAMDIAKKRKLRPISEEYPTDEALMWAPV